MNRFVLAVLALLTGPTVLAAQSTLSGFVISLESGQPVAGATVELKDASGLAIPGYATIRTDQLGAYQFIGLTPGKYQLRVGSIYEVAGEPLRYMLASSSFTVQDEFKHIYVGISELAFRSELDLTMQLARRARDWEAPYPTRDRLAALFFRSAIKDDRGREFLTSEWTEDMDGRTIGS